MNTRKIWVLTVTLTMFTGILTGCDKNNETSSSSQYSLSSISDSETTKFDVSKLTPDSWEDCLKYEINYNDEVEITDCSNATYIIIPDMIEGHPVTSIGRRAFAECQGLKAVKIGNNVEYIGAQSFEYSGLEYIDIPDSVTKIGDGAFQGTPLYKSYDKGIIYIDGWAVECASEESELIFESGTRGIGCFAFFDCDYIKTIVIPDIPYIADSSFTGCKNLTSVIFGEGVNTIGENAFSECYLLNNVDFGNTVSKIGFAAFKECYNLTSVALPKSLCTIGSDAFESCGFTEITIPENVKYVGESVFNQCNQLKSVTFESTECEIGNPNQVDDTIPRNAIVRGYSGSTSQRYAEDWYLDFEIIDSENKE